MGNLVIKVQNMTKVMNGLSVCSKSIAATYDMP